jgi:N-acetyl-alpha-D-muramate 1-phosphate uridylyltransferase
MIFAAGLGTRMGALTRDQPKPLLTVGGRALIDHALDLARDAGARPIVANAHAHADQVVAHLAKAAPEALISRETLRLETGGGLRAALPLLGASPVFTLNADIIWRGPNPLTALAAAWNPAHADALLALVPRGAALGHSGPGDFDMDGEGRLTRRGRASSADYVYAGVQIIDTSAVATEPPGAFSLNRIWDRMLAAGRLYGLAWQGLWVDVGRPESFALAEAELAR